MSAASSKAAGNAAIAQNKWKDALRHYTEAINVDSTDHTLFSNRSLVQLELRNTDAALADAMECVRLDPTFARGHVRCGEAHAAVVRDGKAIVAFEKAAAVAGVGSAIHSSATASAAAVRASRLQRVNKCANQRPWIYDLYDNRLLLPPLFPGRAAVSVTFWRRSTTTSLPLNRFTLTPPPPLPLLSA